MKKENKLETAIRCADCQLSVSIPSPFGNPAIVQCEHTLLVRVANSIRKCETFKRRNQYGEK